jgi:hypothetical protein
MTGGRRRYVPIESLEGSRWVKAFQVSFGVLCSIIFLAVCTHVFPDASEVVDSQFPGFKQWVGFLDALGRIDAMYQSLMFWLPFLSFLITGIGSGILVRIFQRLIGRLVR